MRASSQASWPSGYPCARGARSWRGPGRVPPRPDPLRRPTARRWSRADPAAAVPVRARLRPGVALGRLHRWRRPEDVLLPRRPRYARSCSRLDVHEPPRSCGTGSSGFCEDAGRADQPVVDHPRQMRGRRDHRGDPGRRRARARRTRRRPLRPRADRRPVRPDAAAGLHPHHLRRTGGGLHQAGHDVHERDADVRDADVLRVRRVLPRLPAAGLAGGPEPHRPADLRA